MSVVQAQRHSTDEPARRAELAASLLKTTIGMRRVLLWASLVSSIAVAYAPAVKRVGRSPSAAEIAQFWVARSSARNLFDGPPNEVAARPQVDARYTVLKRDPRGFSITYRVRDERANEWNVKLDEGLSLR